MSIKVFIGWDAHQDRACRVAAKSLVDCTRSPIELKRISREELTVLGLYHRPTRVEGAGLWDVISEAPMSTGHAIARFLVPFLCGYDGWALFTDGDVLFRADVAELFALADPRYAVQVVQHQHVPSQTVKMEGQTQTRYFRKNWSSVILWNAGHPANRAVSRELVNTVPGRDLHRFCWLEDELIGALPSRWNVLIGEQTDPDPAICHFTLGVPDMPGYEDQPYADEWRAVDAAVTA
jgi:hypothetical protein